ncbi:MAG: zinc-binding dehydrogenase [Candidatus Bathyarchaeota archaeon]|nr:zinc-binding dehydrogenase [Candidatus Bathyarchaeota archaeon]
MKAAVYHGPRNIKIEEVPEPQVKGSKVLVKFKAGSICGTDLHLYRGDWKIKRGRIIGHDAWGIRADTGERVVMSPVTNCGKCYFCMHGQPSLCERVLYYGLTKGGFFAQSIAIKEKNLIPIPDAVSDDEAAMMEPVALALHTLNLLKPNADDFATVVGQGPIGLLMTQIAKLKGCRVIAVDTQTNRLRLAEKLGAEYTINPTEEDIPKRVREITGRGSDVVVEAAGTQKTVEQTPFLVRKAGRVALVGEFEGYLNLGDADEACFFSTYISAVEYPTAVNLVAHKKVDLQSLITHKFKLADFEKAIQTANDPTQKPIKVIISA